MTCTAAIIAACAFSPVIKGWWPINNVIYQNNFNANAQNWPSTDHCFFSDGSYHVKGSSSESGICFAPGAIGDQADMDVKVTANLITGGDEHGYGIMVRANSNNDFYALDILSNGLWGLGKCLHTKSGCDVIAGNRVSADINSGPRASNVLEVTAKGTHFEIYVNGTKVGQTDDSAITSGEIALVCGVDTEVAFTNFSVSTPAWPAFFH